ncbi:MAG: class II aldolase/adducin family protein [Myxococcota bacterium]|jgi:ribulose-5-phosphate 4-epimerase/fuculose-1-phosphate aldolase|nr:class II aldolase/adducin family protein [Myxococcota bacterium]
MERLVAKYSGKLEDAGLAEKGEALLVTVDDEPFWSGPDALRHLLEPVLRGLNVTSLCALQPKEPYRAIIEHLASTASSGAICPQDSETRTFLHEIPVVEEASAAAILATLRRRKCAVLPGGLVVTHGTVTLEQAFVSLCSVCFACFVKLHADALRAVRRSELEPAVRLLVESAARHDSDFRGQIGAAPTLHTGPFEDEISARAAICQVGKATVERRLVDSYFGNVSYRCGDLLHISQTGAALDELETCIDPCSLTGGSSVGITASSELRAHRGALETTGKRAVLHGHPRYTVALSLDCEQAEECDKADRCHTECERTRRLFDIPVVPGEVGSGRHGLYRTLPEALRHSRGAIVYGHGLFTTGRLDFIEAFAALEDIERLCKNEVAQRLL